MMIAEPGLDHTPPTTWACYTSAGATAAGSSNLALGTAGPSSIRAYIRDSGTYNYAVGHRRWILLPTQIQMSTGSTDAVNSYYYGSNALWVFAPKGSRPAVPSIVAWPPPGYVPYQVVYDRWSMSLNSAPSAGYASATVSMTADGSPVSLDVVSRTGNGYGDNTIVWEPAVSFSAGQPDLTVHVSVSNISGASDVSYDVIIFDPAVASNDIFADGFETGNTSRWSVVIQ